MTDRLGRTAIRTIATPTIVAPRTAVLRIVIRVTVTTEAAIRADREDRRATDRIADSSRTEEATAMAASEVTEEATASRDLADRVVRTVRAIVVVQALVRAVTVALTVHRAITEAMADREPDSETGIRIRASLERLRQRIWKRGARTIRDAQAAVSRRISVPRGSISMRKTRR